MSGLLPLQIPKLRRLFVRYVPYFHCLESVSWFYTDEYIQQKLLKVVILRLGRKVLVEIATQILVGRKNFDSHLNTLILEYALTFNCYNLPVDNMVVLKLFRKNVRDFWYLEERGWFMYDLERQIKLLKCVCFGLTRDLNVIAGDFNENLDALLFEYFLHDETSY